MTDALRRMHEAWLGMAQPIEGLVFSATVLADKGVGRPDERSQRGELGPPREHEPAVPARRAPAADVALEDDDVAGRLRLLDANRRPQADVAAADDRHVGARTAGEGRRRGRVAGDFVEPQGAMHGTNVVESSVDGPLARIVAT